MKFKLRSIWKSAELKAIGMVFFMVLAVALVMVYPEKDIPRQELSPIRLASAFSVCISAFIILRSIYVAWKQRK